MSRVRVIWGFFLYLANSLAASTVENVGYFLEKSHSIIALNENFIPYFGEIANKFADSQDEEERDALEAVIDLDGRGFLFFRYYPEDYMALSQMRNLTSTQLLSMNQKHIQKRNLKSENIELISEQLIGWLQQVKYDTNPDRISWAFEHEENGARVAHIVTLYLGRYGFEWVEAIGYMEHYPFLRYLMNDTVQLHKFNTGYRYEDHWMEKYPYLFGSMIIFLMLFFFTGLPVKIIEKLFDFIFFSSFKKIPNLKMKILRKSQGNHFPIQDD